MFCISWLPPSTPPPPTWWEKQTILLQKQKKSPPAWWPMGWAMINVFLSSAQWLCPTRTHANSVLLLSKYFSKEANDPGNFFVSQLHDKTHQFFSVLFRHPTLNLLKPRNSLCQANLSALLPFTFPQELVCFYQIV